MLVSLPGKRKRGDNKAIIDEPVEPAPDDDPQEPAQRDEANRERRQCSESENTFLSQYISKLKNI